MKTKRIFALVLSVLMILPILPLSAFAVAETVYGTVDFESFTAGQTLTTSDGFAVAAPINKVLEENGNKFLRLPIAATSTSSLTTAPTNRGKYFQIPHTAFSTTEKTSVTVDLRMNGLSASTTPNIGLWLRKVGYTNASGTAATQEWYRLIDFNLLTGQGTFKSVTGTKTGAAGLVADAWNTVEVIFNPANGAFDIYINNVLYANCTAPVTGTNFTVAANMLMFAVDSGNNANAYTAVASLDSTYSNANYMDADNFKVALATDKTGVVADFEGFAAGNTLTASNGFALAAPINKVLVENGNKFVRMPIAATDLSNLKTAPTNRGQYFQFKHDAFSATAKTSITVDLRMNGVSGSTTPHIGVWLRKVSYTDTSGATQTRDWFHLLDVNLLTGEVATDTSFAGSQAAIGTPTGAVGLKTGEWNELEVIFDPTDGSFEIYVNGSLYANCVSPVTGTSFTVAANMLLFAMPNTNNANTYTAVADLDATYSNANSMDADNFAIKTVVDASSKPVWSQDFESASQVSDVVVSGKKVPVDSSIATDATNAGNKVLQWVNTPKGTSDYYLWVDTNNKTAMTDAVLNEDGTVSGTATVGGVTYNVTGTVNTTSLSSAATVNSASGTAKTVYVVTDEYADAIGGGCGNVMVPIYFRNPAMSNTDVEDFVFDMEVYLASGTKGHFASQISSSTVSASATRHLQPWRIIASGTSAELCINTNGEYIGKSGKVSLNMDQWYRITAVIDKETSYYTIYLDGKYVFANQNKAGSTGNYGYVGEPVNIVANSYFIQSNRGRSAANNAGTIQIDNVACYNSINELDFVISRENFESYSSKVGQSVTLGTNVHAGATYTTDPTAPSNVAVKVPMRSLESSVEILMRMSGAYPVQNGYYTVTRNADTNAVEVSGYTVTEESGGTYTITDGTTTYTGLRLGTMQDYCDYWGGDGTVDQNWKLPHPAISYSVHESFVFSLDYYLSADACGKFFTQAHNYYVGETATSWLSIFSVDATKGSIGLGNATNNAVLTKGAWNNVTASIDLVSGAITLYVNGTLVESGFLYTNDGAVAANLSFDANKISFCKVLRKDNAYYGSLAGYVLVDNVEMLPATSSEVTLEADRLMYVEMNGEKIFSNKIFGPHGMSYNAVYFKDEDYSGMLTTEQKNSIRLSAAAGLRFATRVDTDLLDSLYALLDEGLLSDVTVGTLIAPTDYVTTEFTMEALTTEGKKYLAVEADREMYFEFDTDASTTHFVGSIVDFYESNITRDFSGRGYASVTLRSGQTVNLYSTVTQSDNVCDVATRVLALGGTYTETQQNILDLFAAGKQPPLSERAQMVQDLLDLNVLAIGDSVFQGHTLDRSEQWISLLAKESYWNLTNLGKNGWTVAKNDAAYPEGSTVRNSMYDYLFNNADYQYGTTSSSYYTYGDTTGKTAEDVDLILLEGGWNDFGWGLPLGTVDDTDGSTLMGAMKCMVDKLLTDYPNAQIILVTTWHNSDTRSKDGAARIDFVANAMKNLQAAKYADNSRVKLIDMGDPAVSGAYMADASWRATYALDTVHLNEEGMKIVAENMLEQIWKTYLGK